ncbi:MAG: serine/threonine-protein phosphatase [Treponemataceae bacterium]|nr:serine/threonine-protein phosphatase [Treponemataceae bacterium]
MIFILLNFVLAACAVAATVYVDRVETKYHDGMNPVVTNILILAVVTAMYSLFLSTRQFMTPALFSLLMRVCLLLEACMLINISFCFVYYAWKSFNQIILLVKVVLYLFSFWLIFFNFKDIYVHPSTGIEIQSAYLFSGAARSFFPWTWVSLFNGIFRFGLPAAGCVAMLVRNEMKATKLEKFKGCIYALGLLSMWILVLALKLSSDDYPGFMLLHFYIYVPLLVIFPIGSWVAAAPSGRAIVSFIVKCICMYVLPAAVMGFVFMMLYPMAKEHMALFVVCMLATAGAILWVVTTMSRLISKSKFGHSADYAANFEKDLASIDYSGEMADIAETMFHIFRKNAEASSMAVFINGGNGIFDPAYSSSSRKYKLSNPEALFESLLNIGKNVVISSEVESLHALEGIKGELGKFFKDTASDALFILNEGRDVHGFILLGLKASGDHYKEYDLNVFTKLYSYFFVFGYYMRNIANSEIIGTVNRELRMSSQIITSIQENIDLLENPKIDAGCIMIPAHNIGGEFVDMIRLTDTRHLFVVGDLSGKGIAASMSMVILKAIIRAYLSETHDFKSLVVKINSFIRNNLQKGTIFAGMFAIMNFENDTLYYINCGIPAIFLYTEAYNNVIEIQGSGHILGFVSDISPYISVKQIKLHKNDIVFTCTDGLIESHSLRGEEYGKDRIQRNMVANSMYPAYRMAHFVYDDLVKFMSHEMEDDVSVLVMKYLAADDSEKPEPEVAAQKEMEGAEQAAAGGAD